MTVNASKPIHCSFCHGNHAVNSNKCEKQAMLKQGAMVYKLSLSDESQGKNLKDRIKMTMPLKQAYVTVNVFSLTNGFIAVILSFMKLA